LEDAALEMLVSLLRLGDWKGRTFTTGATGSNVLGLACGREAILEKRGQSIGEVGLLAACLSAGVRELQILTSAGHSSLSKAASIVGFGRGAVKELRLNDSEPWRLDLEALERELQTKDTASVIALSAGEVNTGRYALTGAEEMRKVRELADKYGAWIHVDGGKIQLFCKMPFILTYQPSVSLLALFPKRTTTRSFVIVLRGSS
jgi:glutamate/tyrosine decarboxylase-like PLP-dependent enzyme